MVDVRLDVHPASHGWQLDPCAAGLQPLHFRSEAQAEAQAHALARGFAISGVDARVTVHDGANHLVGATRYFAQDGPWLTQRRPRPASSRGCTTGG